MMNAWEPERHPGGATPPSILSHSPSATRYVISPISIISGWNKRSGHVKSCECGLHLLNLCLLSLFDRISTNQNQTANQTLQKNEDNLLARGT